ncbi:MAG: hypothetical protein NTY77_15990 [Elusimicrobia bacterium]|nr:hypothetical protein [Elusimicrobiota bacterium]
MKTDIATAATNDSRRRNRGAPNHIRHRRNPELSNFIGNGEFSITAGFACAIRTTFLKCIRNLLALFWR